MRFIILVNKNDISNENKIVLLFYHKRHIKEIQVFVRIAYVNLYGKIKCIIVQIRQ